MDILRAGILGGPSMKYVTLFIALFSAFFMSNLLALDYDETDLKPAKVDGKQFADCSFDGKLVTIESSNNPHVSDCLPVANPYLKSRNIDTDVSICNETYFDPMFDSSTKMRLIKRFWRESTSSGCSVIQSTYTMVVTISPPRLADSYSCPPEGLELYSVGPIVINNVHMCGKFKDPDCPPDEPSHNNPYVLTAQPNSSVCFPAYYEPETRQCEIKLDKYGGYYLPKLYRDNNIEPVECADDPDPDNNSNNPDLPVDEKDPESPKTPDPEPDEPDPETDDSDKDNEVDALNQVNDNLNAINDNISNSSDSSNRRLDRLADETQITNDFLNTLKNQGIDAAGKTNELIKATGELAAATGELVQSNSDIAESAGQTANNTKEASDSLKEINDGLNKGSGNPVPAFDKAKSASFWESEYEDGFEGIWSENQAAFEQTDALKFLNKLKLNPQGSPPAMNVCFDLGFINFGCQDINMQLDLILPFIKICILITAAFACRRIIFGG